MRADDASTRTVPDGGGDQQQPGAAHQRGGQTSFDKLIDSGDLGRSSLTDGWQPRQVYDAYLAAIHSGKFTYTRTLSRGTTTVVTKYTFGGVDLSNLRLGTVSAEEMARQNPHLPQTVQISLSRSTTGTDGSYWLAGAATMPRQGGLSRITGAIGWVRHAPGRSAGGDPVRRARAGLRLPRRAAPDPGRSARTPRTGS